MNKLEHRVGALEGRTVAGSGIWHRLVMRMGDKWGDVLAAYPRVIEAGDSVMVLHIVETGPDGGVLTSPELEAEKAKCEMWLAAHDARRSSGSDLTVVIKKPAVA